tara:strand:- start:183 stop:983 length:801 start_codon:yes stop_codon:yes gene_type:complete
MKLNVYRPNSVKLRRLTNEGVFKFKDAWGEIYSDKKENKGENLHSLINLLPLIDDEYSTEIQSAPALDLSLEHKNRYFLAEYLFKNLDDFFTNKRKTLNLKNDYNFWAWMALVYVNGLTRDFRKITEVVRFIPDAGDFKGPGYSLLYRHAIRESYLMYEMYKEESKIYFSPRRLADMGDFWEQIRARYYMRRHKSMHKYLVKKYSHPDGSGYARPKATEEVVAEKDMGFSSVRRLVHRYKNISVIYAAPLCDENKLGEILGPGFDI